MNKIDQLFQEKEGNILSIYITAGYPNLEDTATTILALQNAGVDLIEVGMPYSDPMADGPTIQQSSQKAISNGLTLPLFFEQLASIKDQVKIPLVFMGYFNQIMQYGDEAFFAKCKEVGISGLILPDLPLYEYKTFYQEKIEDQDLKISFLMAPQTSVERMREIEALSSGFIYVVADSSITGTKSGISGTQVEYFERVKAMDLKRPTMIGFGISDHQAFSTACQYAKGAIIGSAFILEMEDDKRSIEEKVASFVSGIKG